MSNNGKNVFLAGSGSYLPGKKIPFSEIDKILGELDQAPDKIRKWMNETKKIMEELLEVKYFHYAIDPVTREFSDDNITMSVKASLSALEYAGMKAEDIDLICYGSPHQDQMPTASTKIQEMLGIESCQEISIHANCTSAYKALHIATELIRGGRACNALVISSNIASSELRAEYYNQQIVDRDSIFLRWFLCDGAGALVLTSNQSFSKGFKVDYTYIESIGGKRPSMMFNLRPAYWMNPKIEFEKGYHHLRQKFRNALSTPIFQEKDGSVFFCGLKRMLEKGSIAVDKIKFMQINLPAKHIAQSVKEEIEKLGIPPETFYTKLDELGYPGPPMAFICLDKIIREEKLQKGDLIVSFVTEVSKFMQAGYSICYDPHD